MFNLKAKFLLAAAVLFIGGVSAANAQLGNGSEIKVSVPNAFVLRGESFSAGIYSIVRTPTTIDSNSLLILRGENGESMIFDTIVGSSNKAADATQLVFDAVGGTNYLSAILVKGSTVKNEIAKTKAQRRSLAEGVGRRFVVTVTDSGF
jgi:hypothetical protein